MKISNLEILMLLLISINKFLCASPKNDDRLFKNFNQNEIKDGIYNSNAENTNNYLERKELNMYFWCFFADFLIALFISIIFIFKDIRCCAKEKEENKKNENK